MIDDLNDFIYLVHIWHRLLPSSTSDIIKEAAKLNSLSLKVCKQHVFVFRYCESVETANYFYAGRLHNKVWLNIYLPMLKNSGTFLERLS